MRGKKTDPHPELGAKRVWAFEVYPESAPKNWLQILKDYKVPMHISPLHDQDTDEQGKPKKPHYHIVMTYDGKQKFEEPFALTSSLGQPIPIRVKAKVAMCRYLCHLDNPEKAQYPVEQVISYAGANYTKDAQLDGFDMVKLLPRMEEFIDKYHIRSMKEFQMYARVYEPLWHKAVITRCHKYIRDYIYDSMHDPLKNDEVQKRLDQIAHEEEEVKKKEREEHNRKKIKEVMI